MKRCPECRRDYTDDSLLYCLEDGTALIQGPVPSPDESQTVILHDTAPSGDPATRALMYTTEETAVLPSGAAAFPKSATYDKRWLIASLVIAVVALVSFFAYRYFKTADIGRINSIAVLPFENSGENPDAEYLSDGLAESLIYRLSQLPDLKVSPRSLVFQYKGKAVNPQILAAELDVDAVMTGRIVQRGDNLNISIDLVDARSNKTLWGEQFERKMSDLLATQREIAATITQKLQLKLAGDAAVGITKNYTNSNDAYRDYLQGRFYWNKRSPEAMAKAVEQLENAVKKDPNFALAYAGLADAQMIVGYLSRKWSDDYLIGKARENATRAIHLDPTLAEPHATLGLIGSNEWKWGEAENEYKRALELNPKYATTYHWYSRLLRAEGRFPEALELIRRGQEADPLSLPIAENVVQNLIESGDLDGALAQCKRSLEIDPNYWSIHSRMASVYFAMGQKEEALAEASKAIDLVGHVPFALGSWGYALGAAGKHDEALAVAKELEKMYAAREMDGVRIASVYVGLGDKDKAFEWLEKDFQARRPNLMEMRLEPEFRSLRDDPRFKDLLKRMALPE